MICRFCEQWNAARATRCCFCQNPLTATEDGTVGGRPSAAYQGLARLPGENASPAPGRKLWPAGEPQLARHGQTLERVKLIWSVIVAIGIGVLILAQIKYGCH